MPMVSVSVSVVISVVVCVVFNASLGLWLLFGAFSGLVKFVNCFRDELSTFRVNHSLNCTLWR